MILQKKNIDNKLQTKTIRNGVKYRYFQQYNSNFFLHRGVMKLKIHKHFKIIMVMNVIVTNMTIEVHGNSKTLFKSILSLDKD